jgi:hypothetical protein
VLLGLLFLGIWMRERTSTGAGKFYQSLASATPAYWLKRIRSGNVFAIWVQLGTSQTVSMAQSAYVGLAVGSLQHLIAGNRRFRQRVRHFALSNHGHAFEHQHKCV